MSTQMHRLQISLPPRQFETLREWAASEGVSIAEMIRRLIEREEKEHAPPVAPSAIFEIAGIASGPESLIDGIPVSERPDLYISEAALGKAREKRSRSYVAHKTRSRKK